MPYQPLPPPSAAADLLNAFQPQAHRLVAEFKQLWRQGVVADVHDFLGRHADEAADRSLVLDLALAEYWLRAAREGRPDLDGFCARFPALRDSLRGLLETHCFLVDNPHLLPNRAERRWPGPGDTCLGFRLRRELGRGTFARVFLADEPALGGRRVAVKVGFRGTGEARILGPLSHPNVVPVHSVHFDPASCLALVCMPYLGRATLGDVLARAFAGPGRPAAARVILEACAASSPGAAPDEGPDADPEPVAPILRRGTYAEGVLHLAAQLAEALAFIHGRGVYHRDLKPSNVLLSPHGRPMLLDFNLSTDARQAPERTGGTLPYMAPEQLRLLLGEDEMPAGPVDGRSDLFGLGVIVYELLTGKHPFGPLPERMDLGEAVALLLERQRDGPRPLRELVPVVGRSLARLLERCLAFDPDQRLSLAAELARALRRYLGRPQRLRRWVVRRARALTAAGLLLAAAGAAAAHYLPIRPAPSAAIARGWASFESGAYQQAADHFAEAAELAPDSAEAWFGRGRACQRLGEFIPALDSYRKAEQLAPDGRARACMGYCCHRLHHYWAAIEYYTGAIEAGFATAEVFNNRGAAYRELHQSGPAREDFDAAIDRAEHLQAPYHGRALIDLERALRDNGYFPSSGIADIEKALARGAATAGLHRDAACLYAQAARKERRYIEPALDHLQKAIDQGQAPSSLARDSAFAALEKEPRFERLVRQTHSSQSARPRVLVLDPVSDPSR